MSKVSHSIGHCWAVSYRDYWQELDEMTVQLLFNIAIECCYYKIHSHWDYQVA